MWPWQNRKAEKGYIGYYGLSTWWNESFTPDERAYMINVFQPLGGAGNTLTDIQISHTSGSMVGFLGNLASWFSREADRHLAVRIIDKAMTIEGQAAPVLDRHFLYQSALEIFYRGRADPLMYQRAIAACEAQIRLGPEAAAAFRQAYDAPLPSHRGYRQLAIIYDKAGEHDRAIAVCEAAQREGWSGDWTERVERYRRKQNRS